MKEISILDDMNIMLNNNNNNNISQSYFGLH